jgi:serine protease Do
MKKHIVLLIALVFASVSFIVSQSVSGNVTTTTTPVTTIPMTTTNQPFTYYNFDDLIDQIYAQVRAEIYEEIYNELTMMVGEELYEAIYEEVSRRLNDLISDGQIPVVMDLFQDDIFAVVALSNKSVFGITTYKGLTPVSLGSGVVYRFDESTNTYYIITNEHVIDEGDNFKIVFSDNSRVTATLIGFDVVADIAILTFSGVGLDKEILVSPLADSSKVLKGSPVLAVGNPRGYDFYGAVTLGVVSGLDRNVDGDYFVNYIQHDASINSGNSGGPIYNLNGEVVGINVSKYAASDIEGMGFAIPINLVKTIIAKIESGTMLYETIKPRLGITFFDVSSLTITDNKFDVSSLRVSDSNTLTNIKITLPNSYQSGLFIRTILTDGSIFGSTIKVGDLIVKVNDHDINQLVDYYQYLYANFQSGDVVTISYLVINYDTLSYSETIQTITITLK